MPIDLGHLIRIVNVHWAETGGAVFVSGADGQFENSPLIRYAKVKDESETIIFEELGFGSFTGVGVILGSAYALIERTPTFVLVGIDNAGRGIIMVSSNGTIWAEAFVLQAEGDPALSSASITGIVWDETDKAFYASGWKVQDTDNTDLLLRSADGYGWSEDANVKIEEDDPYPRGLLVAHCNERVKDGNGNAVPDGIYGYDKDNDILIRPTILPKISYKTGTVDPGEPTSTVEIISVHRGTADVGISCSSVAFAGGIWMAAGGDNEGKPQTACSFDNGKTWKLAVTPPNSHMIKTITGGSLEEQATA